MLLVSYYNNYHITQLLSIETPWMHLIDNRGTKGLLDGVIHLQHDLREGCMNMSGGAIPDCCHIR